MSDLICFLPYSSLISFQNDYIKHEGPLPPLPHTESTLSLEKPFEEEPLAYGRHGAAEVDWPMAASSEHTHVPGATQPYDCYAFDPMDVMYSHQPQVQPFAQTPLQVWYHYACHFVYCFGIFWMPALWGIFQDIDRFSMNEAYIFVV